MDSKVIIAIIFLFANTIGTSTSNLVPYILNGTIAEMGQFPYFARIEAINNDYRRPCGASIISENWLITVKDCVNGEHEKINVYFGIVSKTEYESSGIVEKDNEFILDDLALLKTSHPIEFSYDVQPIRLVNEFMFRVILMNKEVHIAGMGYYKKDEPSRVLRHGTMRVFSFSEMIKHKQCKTFWFENRICLISEDGHNMAYTSDAGDPIFQEISDETYLLAVMKTRFEGTNINTAIAIQPYISWITYVTKMQG